MFDFEYIVSKKDGKVVERKLINRLARKFNYSTTNLLKQKITLIS